MKDPGSMDGRTNRTGCAVLLVEADDERRAAFGDWLEDAGFEVLTCPGPSAPDYSCVGCRTGHCPLVDPASLVVADVSLSSGVVGQPAVGSEVLGFYLLSDTPIITLGPSDHLLANASDEQVVELPRTPERSDLLDAIRTLVPS